MQMMQKRMQIGYKKLIFYISCNNDLISFHTPSIGCDLSIILRRAKTHTKKFRKIGFPGNETSKIQWLCITRFLYETLCKKKIKKFFNKDL